MKNIFVLPTDKPSRLHNKNGELGNYPSTKLYIGDFKGNQYNSFHIYITSNEEISGLENNIWVYNNGRVWLWENTMALRSNNKPKKIILTTDQDLIADGVQAIDDEFLEWFVKNPSCEKVEVRKIGEEWIYNADVPKKEPKQYPIGGYAPGNYTCTCITCKQQFFGDKRAVQCEPCAIEMVNVKVNINKEGGIEETNPEPNFYEKLKEYFENTPREKVLEDWNKSAHLDNVGPTVDEFIENSNKEIFKNLKTISSKDIDPEFVEIVNDNFWDLIDSSEKTLEEVADKLSDELHAVFEMNNEDAFLWILNILNKGAKWQAERMYSEEEVLIFTQTKIQQYKFGNTNIEQLDLLKESLGQFKKK
jgi:hypothetical protein